MCIPRFIPDPDLRATTKTFMEMRQRHLEEKQSNCCFLFQEFFFLKKLLYAMT